VKPTSAGVVVATFTAALVTVALVVPSVAIKAQLVPTVTVTVNGATPLTAGVEPPPVNVHVDVIVMLSVLPVTILPLASSSETRNTGISTLIVAAVAGTVV
jgi:hypothetical protein